MGGVQMHKSLMIAALLHDLGKVVRRADKTKGEHVSAGVNFIKSLELEIDNIEEIIEAVKNHHYRDLKKSKLRESHMAYILYEADNIASAIDRRKYEEINVGNEMMPLHSVFNVLRQGKNRNIYVHKPNNNLEKEIDLPIQSEEMTKEYDYLLIQKELERNLRSIDFNEESIETILSVFENVLKNVPAASYKDVPDISLYDHLKMTAAISDCLYKYYTAKGITNFKEVCFKKNEKHRTDNQYLLVSGDFSGIQSFIYTISSKKAMKALRGRSSFLEILNENLVDSILEGAGCTRANLIFSGGGNFNLLLPNTEEVKEFLELTKNNVNNWFMNRFNIQLYLEIKAQECSSNEIANDITSSIKENNLVGEIYSGVSTKLAEGKMNRYTKDQLANLFDQDSNINKLRHLDRECKTCKSSRGNLIEGVCEYCLSYEWLGQKLASLRTTEQEKYLVILDDIYEGEKSFVELPNADGETAYLQIVSEESYGELLKQNRIVRAYSVNSLKVGTKLMKNIWMGNYNVRASKKYGLIEFDELVKKSVGINRLAVLRADIDNLGMAFVNGFVNEDEEAKYRYVSLTRSAVLSRKLTEFFKQNINEIANMSYESNQFEYAKFLSGTAEKRDICLVYSGGDDLFAIGTWNHIIEFAIDLRTIFKIFTQGKLTFSAGIGMFRNGFPVSQMAEITGEIEKRAKNNEGKDSIALFDEQVFKWDDFFEKVVKEKFMKICKWFDLGEEEKADDKKIEIGKTTVYKFMLLIRERLEKGGSLNLARFAYTIARLKKTKQNEGNYNEMRVDLLDYLKRERDVQHLLMAFQLLLYKLREKE